jgi:hypothetical protein
MVTGMSLFRKYWEVYGLVTRHMYLHIQAVSIQTTCEPVTPTGKRWSQGGYVPDVIVPMGTPLKMTFGDDPGKHDVSVSDWLYFRVFRS